MLRNLWLALWRLLFLQRRRHYLRRIFIEQSGAEAQRPTRRSDVILVRGGDRDKWLRFACPNHCGTTISLNLSPTRSPSWRVTPHQDGTVSVHPSVIHDSCGAHFWVRHNRIEWV